MLGSFKINCRAISDIKSNSTGIGIVLKNHEGVILSSSSLFQRPSLDFVTANAAAILKGFQFGKSFGLLNFCVESDVITVVNLINPGLPVNSSCGNIVSDIHIFMKELGISSIAVGRNGSNGAALLLARQALLRKKDLIWRRLPS